MLVFARSHGYKQSRYLISYSYKFIKIQLLFNLFVDFLQLLLPSSDDCPPDVAVTDSQLS